MKKIYLSVLLFIVFAFAAQAQWTTLNTGTTSNLQEIVFPAVDTGFAVGDSGTFIKTVDGGINWTTIPVGTGRNLFDIYFIDTQNGWVVGDSGCYCNTNDGGSTWACNYLDTAVDKTLNAIFALNNNIIVMGGTRMADGMILKSTDGGISWTEGILESFVWNISISKIFLINQNIGYASTRGGIYKSVDGFNSWLFTDTASVFSGQMFTVLEDMQFFGADTGYACGWYPGYLGTTYNGGTQWAHNDSFQLYTLDFLNIQTGYMAGWCGAVKTSDGGLTFTDASGSNPNLFCSIYSMDFTDEWTGYACGYNGVVLKTTNGGATKVDDTEKSSSLEIFPNPAKGNIFVKNLPTDFFKNGNIFIADISGRKTGVDFSFAEETMNIDLSNLPSGIYFLNINSDKINVVQKFVVQ